MLDGINFEKNGIKDKEVKIVLEFRGLKSNSLNSVK